MTALNSQGGMLMYPELVLPVLLYTEVDGSYVPLMTAAAAINPKNYVPLRLMIRALPLPTLAAAQSSHLQMVALLKPLLLNILDHTL
jgi:hypothetical protein